MKILKIVANNFKLCEKDFTLSFVPEANKNEDDKEFELHEIAEDLYTYTTVGIIGKNASGKTTAVDLLSLVFDIFSFFRVNSTLKLFYVWNKKINLDISFFHEGYLYRYLTDLNPNNDSVKKTVSFENQKIYRRKYYKKYSSNLFDYNKYEFIKNDINLPEDTSILYNVLKKIDLRGVFCSSNDVTYVKYSDYFDVYKMINGNYKIVEIILKMFDEHLKNIEMLNEDKFKICYSDGKLITVSNKELYDMLSSGTTKGFGLFTFVVYSLKNGSDLVIDEIENHFHKKLVENLVNLYKDKTVNKKNATLIFTTHYCELLDLFNRTDNIYITKYTKNITIENVYSVYKFRPELLKSKKFYNNTFGTNVDYEILMSFKRELMK